MMVIIDEMYISYILYNLKSLVSNAHIAGSMFSVFHWIDL